MFNYTIFIKRIVMNLIYHLFMFFIFMSHLFVLNRNHNFIHLVIVFKYSFLLFLKFFNTILKIFLNKYK